MNPDALRIGAVVVAVIALILLVTRFRLHPFVTLIVVSIFLGLACGLPPVEVIKHFEKGFGDVLSFVGIVIGLGTMLGGMLVFSGGAERLATGLVSLGGKKFVPWTIFFAALLIGLPLFFEVGFVLLVPLAFAISKKMQTSILLIGLPMVAGLSIAHGLVPPHPAPTLAVSIFHADAGKTIFYAIIVGLPTGLLAGPVFALLVSRWITTGPKHGAVLAAEDIADIPAHEVGAKHHAKGIDSAPSMRTVLTTVLLPPVLMMSRSVADAFLPADNAARIFFDFVGDPIVALLIALFFAIYALGLRQGDDMGRIQEILNRALGPISCGDRHCRCRRRI